MRKKSNGETLCTLLFALVIATPGVQQWKEFKNLFGAAAVTLQRMIWPVGTWGEILEEANLPSWWLVEKMDVRNRATYIIRETSAIGGQPRLLDVR